VEQRAAGGEDEEVAVLQQRLEARGVLDPMPRLGVFDQPARDLVVDGSGWDGERGRVLATAIAAMR
jgi:hypothetical protein